MNKCQIQILIENHNRPADHPQRGGRSVAGSHTRARLRGKRSKAGKKVSKNPFGEGVTKPPYESSLRAEIMGAKNDAKGNTYIRILGGPKDHTGWRKVHTTKEGLSYVKANGPKGYRFLQSHDRLNVDRALHFGDDWHGKIGSKSGKPMPKHLRYGAKGYRKSDTVASKASPKVKTKTTSIKSIKAGDTISSPSFKNILNPGGTGKVVEVKEHLGVDSKGRRNKMFVKMRDEKGNLTAELVPIKGSVKLHSPQSALKSSAPPSSKSSSIKKTEQRIGKKISPTGTSTIKSGLDSSMDKFKKSKSSSPKSVKKSSTKSKGPSVKETEKRISKKVSPKGTSTVKSGLDDSMDMFKKAQKPLESSSPPVSAKKSNKGFSKTGKPDIDSTIKEWSTSSAASGGTSHTKDFKDSRISYGQNKKGSSLTIESPSSKDSSKGFSKLGSRNTVTAIDVSKVGDRVELGYHDRNYGNVEGKVVSKGKFSTGVFKGKYGMQIKVDKSSEGSKTKKGKFVTIIPGHGGIYGQITVSKSNE